VVTLSRRRVVLAGACAVLIVLPAISGWTAGRAIHRERAAASASAPAPARGTGPLPSFVPQENAVVSAPPSTVPMPASLPPPVGWKLSDIPHFGPIPVPEPITLPPGDEVPLLSRIPVTQPVAFLTIDDGILKNPEAAKLLAAAQVPVTLFLTTDDIHDDVPFFDHLRTYGAVVEAHTISHPELRGRSTAFQRRQICGSADRLGDWYGRRPVLFRPPFGDQDHTTLRVAKECGLRAAFIWKETVNEGKVRFQQGHTVQPGDIILMHFRPAFIKDFLGALKAIHRAGLIPALLEDYVPGPPPTQHTRGGPKRLGS
jgi:peptidoglycan/xylan/chitin deacetylase (PgdA/CDA1 family)